MVVFIHQLRVTDRPAFFRPAEKKVVKISAPTSASEVSVVWVNKVKMHILVFNFNFCFGC